MRAPKIVRGMGRDTNWLYFSFLWFFAGMGEGHRVHQQC